MINPRKYENLTKDLLDKVCRASPLFEQKLEEAKSIVDHYSDLIKEEQKLLKEKQEELEKRTSGQEKCQQNQEMRKKSYSTFVDSVKELKEVVNKEALLAVNVGKDPLIYKVKYFSGITPLIQDTRLKSRLISLKSQIAAKQDELRSLKRNVFCLDIEDDENNYSIKDKQNYVNQSQIKEEKYIDHMSQFLKQSLHLSYPKCVVASINNLVNIFKQKIVPINVDSNIPLDIAIYRRSQKYTDHPIDVKFSLDELAFFDSQMKEKINDIFDEIETLYNERQQILHQFYLSKQEQVKNVKILACINILMASSKAIKKAQNTINILNREIRTNTAIPSDIWSTEKRIHIKMEQLINSIDRLSDILSKSQIYGEIKNIGYSDIDEPVVVYETPQTQIAKCNELINQLNSEYAKIEAQQISISSFIEDTVNIFSQADNNKEVENEEEDLSQIVEDDSGYEELMQLLNELVLKQKEELSSLKELINDIPDQLKSIDFDDSCKNRIEIPKIQIHPILEKMNNDALDSDISSIMESNLKLIEQIKAKSYHVEISNFNQSNDLSNHKIIKNKKLESIIDNVQLKISNFIDCDQMPQLIEKRQALSKEFEILQKDYLQFQTENKERAKRIKILEEEINALTNECEEINHKIRDQTTKLKNSPSYIKKSLSSIDHLEEKKKKWQERIAANKENQDKYEKILKEIESLKKELARPV